MAQWMTQTINAPCLVTVYLEGNRVVLKQPGEPPCALILRPSTQDDAHNLAKALRMTARRLEEIGKVLQ